MANGWRGSNRKSRLPADWGRLRKVVLERSGFRCQWTDGGDWCGAPATDVDHIQAGDDSSLHNLQSLCRTHHLEKTGKEARAKQLRFKKLARLPEEKQPGIIDGPPTPTQYKGF